MLLEFNSDKAVEWLQDMERQKAFLTQLHKLAIVKLRLYNIIVICAVCPTLLLIWESFRPKKDAKLCKVEESNRLDEGDVVRAR